MIYLELLFVFLKIGFFTIGGGYAMIPLMRSELLSRGWATEESIMNFIGIAESTPGPFAVNMATFVGFDQAGVGGSAMATLGVVFPSFLIILIIANLFTRFSSSDLVKGVFWALAPLVVALVASATFTLFCTVVLPNIKLQQFTFDFSNANLAALPIFAVVLTVSFFKIKKKKLHPILLVLLSAGLGIVVYGIIL